MNDSQRIAATPLALIGNTPLVHLRRISERAGATILGKCEFLNPTGSVKDRAALFMVERAETRGALRPGGTIVEGTAGNTGIGLAMVAAAKGYRCVFVIPETMSGEKIAFARLLGAEVVLTKQAPWSDPEHYNQVARRLAASRENAVHLNQFDNLDNVASHYETTGPEIWAQTGGRVDAIVMGAGTGGTITGIARALKERNPRVRAILADPQGSVYQRFVACGEAAGSGSSILEGVGIGRVPLCFDRDCIDEAITIPDQDAVDEAYRLLWEEGLYVGGSAGLSLAGAVRYAAGEGRGKTIVCNLCDTGSRYASTIFRAEWLHAKGLRVPGR